MSITIVAEKIEKGTNILLKEAQDTNTRVYTAIQSNLDHLKEGYQDRLGQVSPELVRLLEIEAELRARRQGMRQEDASSLHELCDLIENYQDRNGSPLTTAPKKELWQQRIAAAILSCNRRLFSGAKKIDPWLEASFPQAKLLRNQVLAKRLLKAAKLLASAGAKLDPKILELFQIPKEFYTQIKQHYRLELQEKFKAYYEAYCDYIEQVEKQFNPPASTGEYFKDEAIRGWRHFGGGDTQEIEQIAKKDFILLHAKYGHDHPYQGTAHGRGPFLCQPTLLPMPKECLEQLPPAAVELVRKGRGELRVTLSPVEAAPDSYELRLVLRATYIFPDGRELFLQQTQFSVDHDHSHIGGKITEGEEWEGGYLSLRKKPFAFWMVPCAWLPSEVTLTVKQFWKFSQHADFKCSDPAERQLQGELDRFWQQPLPDMRKLQEKEKACRDLYKMHNIPWRYVPHEEIVQLIRDRRLHFATIASRGPEAIPDNQLLDMPQELKEFVEAP